MSVSVEVTPPPTNRIRQALADGRFFWTIEFVASCDHVLGEDLVQLDAFVRELGRRDEVAGFSVTDRVHSDSDPDPVKMAATVMEHTGSQPLVHWSGKDRSEHDLHDSLAAMQGAGLENLLLLSGDKLKEPPTDRRPRYLESVPAIQIAREHNSQLLIAAALNPFKYREEEAMAQYLKLGKKIGAGADFLITQIGFDIKKHQEALFWMDARGYRVPMVANVMALSAARARYIRRNRLAGVTITDDYFELLQAEEAQLTRLAAGARVTRRLALQIVGLRLLGYSGVQLTAINALETLTTLYKQVDYLAAKCPDRISWNRAWAEALRLPSAQVADTAPADGWYLVTRRPQPAPLRDRLKYHLMDGIHRSLFERGPLVQLLRRCLAPIQRHTRADRGLVRLERAIKAPLFGCETCGLCRLAATQYVCPETCPKGLANGACGGTDMNRCEFEHQECIHSRKYRIAKSVGVLPQLETWLIQAVPEDVRGSSSWPPHFRDGGPRITRVQPGREAER